jgi:adenylate kinase family enzyme
MYAEQGKVVEVEGIGSMEEIYARIIKALGLQGL